MQAGFEVKAEYSALPFQNSPLPGVPFELDDVHDFASDDRASLHLRLVIDRSVRATQSNCGQAHAKHNCDDSHSEQFRHTTHDLSSSCSVLFYLSFRLTTEDLEWKLDKSLALDKLN
jgi:CDGSH-type Zn-finger protein